MKYTKVITLKITLEQSETLKKLQDKKMKVSCFIREAISEKIKRDYKNLIKKPKQINCPF